MRSVDLDELRKIQIQILDITAKFCDEHQIHYWLDSGTLIGAVRHNGYIPWDDDIDIGMLRPDFERFIREFNGYDSRYVVKCVDTDPTFPYAFAKILDTKTILYEPDEKGSKIQINIDLFAYDNAPDDARAVHKQYNRRDFYQYANVIRTMRIKPSGGVCKRLLIRALRLLLLPFPENYFAKKESENARRYNGTETKQIGNFLAFLRIVCDREVLEKFEDHVFEGKMYKVPSAYDRWLTILYGDYMKLPPKEKQVAHHAFKAYIQEDA